MSYPSSVDTGGVPPAILATEASSLAGVASTTLSANTVYLYAFELLVATSFSGAKWRTGSTATGSTDIGIYSASGSLLANLGGIANVASTSMSQAFSGGTVTLGPGMYYMAFASQNGTDTYVGIAASLAGALIESRYRTATNAATEPVSVVVLPSTTGTVNNPAVTKMPAFALTVVGGI